MRAWPHAFISSLGVRARGGVVKLRRSVSHVVRHGHLLTPGQVPLGHVGARPGPTGVRIVVVHPYGSIESSVRAHQVPSGHIGHIGQRPVRSKKSNMIQNGSRIDGLARNKDQMNPEACLDPSRPLLRPKTVKNPTFQGKRPPADLGGPPHSYRRRPGPTYEMKSYTVDVTGLGIRRVAW